jgi:hypothetical protein
MKKQVSLPKCIFTALLLLVSFSYSAYGLAATTFNFTILNKSNKELAVQIEDEKTIYKLDTSGVKNGLHPLDISRAGNSSLVKILDLNDHKKVFCSVRVHPDGVTVGELTNSRGLQCKASFNNTKANADTANIDITLVKNKHS